MLAWANAEALRATMQNGLATFWSRSRNELWEKGKTSGHSMRVTDLRQSLYDQRRQCHAYL